MISRFRSRVRLAFVLLSAVACADRSTGGGDGAAEAGDDGAGPGPSCDPTASCSEPNNCCAESCDECSRQDACVVSATRGGERFACIPIPRACNGEPTCACMGAGLCGEVGECAEADMDGSDLACVCPAC